MTKLQTAILQQPIGSGFEAASTSKDVIKGIDLSGKTAIVTGGYVGLGLETTKILVSAGAKVIVPARSREKALKYLEGVENVEIETMDLMDPDSIDAFAERFLATGEPLHLLINNAGIMWAPLNRDSRWQRIAFFDQSSRTFSTDKLSLVSTPKSQRRTNRQRSSRGHHFSPVIFEDLNFENREYEHLQAYGQSKTANILFAVSLDEKGKNDGIRAFSVHPGGILDTELGRNMSMDEPLIQNYLDADGKPILDPVNGLKTIEQGAATQIWLATNPKLDGLGGLYAEDCEIADITVINDSANEVDEVVRRNGVMPYAI